MRAEFTITTVHGPQPKATPHPPSGGASGTFPTGKALYIRPSGSRLRAVLYALQMNVRVTAGLRGNAAGSAQRSGGCHAVPGLHGGAETPQYRHVTPFASSTSTTPPHSASSLTETTLPALAAVTLSPAGVA